MNIYSAFLRNVEYDFEELLFLKHIYPEIENDPGIAEQNRIAIQEMLDTSTDDPGMTVITIPAGNYYISDSLRIYSHTTISAYGAHITDTYLTQPEAGEHNAHVSIIRGAHICPFEDTERCPHKEYTQLNDIMIEGGIWDRGQEGTDTTYATNVMVFRHGRDIVVQYFLISYT